MKEKISIIGAGSWGTTLAILLSKKGIDVQLHSVFAGHNAKMCEERQNSLFLRGARFPRHLKINPSLEQTLNNNIIVIAIPVEFVRRILKRIKKKEVSLRNKIFLTVSKGIEAKSLKRVSQVIQDELGKVKVAVLSGPNIAREVLEGIPSTCIIASPDKAIARKLQFLFTASTFRVYLHQDMVGVELGGALKNVIAIACGISDGLGFGTNTKAALVTRGLVEISRLGKRMRAQPLTFNGISGLGDLITTCFSSYSRNRSVGEKIGKGKKLIDIKKNMIMVAEGIGTVKSAYHLGRKLNVEMPITREVYYVLYKNKSPRQAVVDLMKRPPKAEQIS